MTRLERIAKFTEAAGHLHTAMMLYSQGRKNERQARAGLRKICELADLAMQAHRAADSTALATHLGNIIGVATADVTDTVRAKTHLAATARAVEAMKHCLDPRSESASRGVLQ